MDTVTHMHITHTRTHMHITHTHNAHLTHTHAHHLHTHTPKIFFSLLGVDIKKKDVKVSATPARKA